MTVDEFIDDLRLRTFRVQVTWRDPQGKTKRRVGTAFAMRRNRRSKQLILATAAHVLKFPEDATVDWSLRTYSEEATISAEYAFRSDEHYRNRGPYSFYEHADVGFIITPADQDTMQLNLPSLPIIHKSRRVTPGTRVGWAGFPWKVEQYLKKPSLCYFDGVVSTFFAEGSRWRYLIDGHLAKGVSGGPVWYWPENAEEDPRVFGIAVAYGLDQKVDGRDVRMPGFTIAEPINPIVAFLEAHYGAVVDPTAQGDRLGD